jgi:DNA repair and recombination RAD54-like protein
VRKGFIVTEREGVIVTDSRLIDLSFSIPVMMNKRTSETIVHQLSHASLGARPHPRLAPRPLHDPMADHAIVLYDPTIDDRPDPSKVDEAQQEEERRKKEEEARGPHKSLKAILGIVDVKKKEDVKVPVVIDPRLAKILRPHQIEGMKVSPPRGAWLTVVLVSLHDRVNGG